MATQIKDTQVAGMCNIAGRGYAHPEVLVSTDWVAEHMNDPNVRIVESNEDVLLYSSGHVPGAVEIDWIRDLNDPLIRDYLQKDGFEALMGSKGIDNDTMVIFYGDKSNWWAAYAFWIFRLFGHTTARLMDGGRRKWEMEKRATSRDVPEYAPTRYEAPKRDDSIERVTRGQVLEHVKGGRGPLVDVRSPQEYSGERLHMPDYPNEGALRGGHIPGARSIPWSRAINPDDGSFLSAVELERIYCEENGLQHDDDVIAYCRIGERSSHTWFVLKYLLGFMKVRNYDGSWTEWGNLVGVPVER